MLTEQTVKELERWVKYPNLYKHKLDEATKSGLLLLVLGDLTVNKELVCQLHRLLAERLKTLDSKKLMKMYKNLNAKSLSINKAHVVKFEENFVRVNPMKRDCARLY